jgi:imidazolonepropionase-like amidohydrolase
MMHDARNAVLACTAALAGSAAGQDLTVKAPPQTQPIAIVNATVHPVSGPDIPRGYVVFDSGVITAVGEGDYTLTGPGTVIDATGKHVYPGLISPWTRLGLVEISAVRASDDFRELGAVTPEVFAAVAVNPDSTLLPVTRSNGVLAAGTWPDGGLVPGRGSVIQLEGWTWEDMAVRRDAGLVLRWPNMRPITAWWMDRPEADQLADIKRNLTQIDDVFDTAAAYVAARAADANHPADLRWEAARGVLPTAGAEQRPVYIVASDLDQITAAVAWAAKRGIKPVIVGGRDAPLAADLLKAHDVPVIVLGTHTFPKRADSAYDDAYTLPGRLEALGVRWCLGSTDDTAHERNLPYNAAMAVAYGLPHDAAVRGVTLSTARILGVSDLLGSIEKGKHATLLITNGSPLEVTTAVERAFIQGRDIDLSNKQTKLAEKYREKYRQQKK